MVLWSLFTILTPLAAHNGFFCAVNYASTPRGLERELHSQPGIVCMQDGFLSKKEPEPLLLPTVELQSEQSLVT